MAAKKPAIDGKLSPRQEAYLKVAQEVALKFIERDRLSLAAFQENFGRIYRTVKKAVEDQD